MRFKKALLTMTVASLVMGMSILTYAADTTVSETGGQAEVQVLLASKSSVFDITVPTSILVATDEDGLGKTETHTVSSGSSALVNVDTIVVDDTSKWSFISDTEIQKADKNGYSLFDIEGSDRFNIALDTAVETHSNAKTIFDSDTYTDNKTQAVISEDGSLDFAYNVEVSPTSDARSEELCKLDYTFSWYEEVL